MCNLTACGAHPSIPAIRVSSAQRRRFLAGLASMPLATVLAIPQLSRAAAGRTETIFITRSGGHPVSGALALPDADKALALPDADKAPAVLLIHEWWGLNDQINNRQRKCLGMKTPNQALFGIPPCCTLRLNPRTYTCHEQSHFVLVE